LKTALYQMVLHRPFEPAANNRTSGIGCNHMSRNATDLEFGKCPRHKNRNPDDGYLGTISDKIWLVTLAKQLPFASEGPAEMPSNAIM